VEINPVDAEKLGLHQGEWVWIVSRRGRIKAPVELTDRSPEGLIFMTFHSPNTKTNLITSPAYDPVTKTPEFKYCAVRIDKVENECKD
jgi:anaerobic selenocysteine-containing dehydrogenase